MGNVTRYAVRIKGSEEYYNGRNTFSGHSFVFSDLQHAKMFKSAAGAKVACGDLYTHGNHELEIVPVEISVNPDIEVIEYEYPFLRIDKQI
jgi:hypothetical protein